jgi:molybdate transport system substrate-binding protein
MTRRHLVALCLTAVLLAPSLSAVSSDDERLAGKILILAAASTTEAIDEIRAEFQRLHPQVTIRTSYGASSTLAQQIDAGADADLFLSASSEWADSLRKKGLVDRQRDQLSNQLVVVVPLDSKLKIEKPADLAASGVRRLALADPRSVPAGVYAREALERLDLWKTMSVRVAGATDVRQALQFVETGAAEVGIVYATDAAASKQVRIALRLEPNPTKPIRYPLVLLKDGASKAAAVKFYDFLGSPAAAAIFRRHGFLLPADSEATRP